MPSPLAILLKLKSRVHSCVPVLIITEAIKFDIDEADAAIVQRAGRDHVPHLILLRNPQLWQVIQIGNCFFSFGNGPSANSPATNGCIAIASLLSWRCSSRSGLRR